MRIAIGIPTYGRAAIVRETLSQLRHQSRPADRIVVCYAREEDLPPRDRRPPGVEWIFSEPGSCRQRNRIIDHVEDCDILLFLDDDFLPGADYLAVLEQVFEQESEVVVATGTVLADGVTTIGLSASEGRDILSRDRGCPAPLHMTPVANGYGCNMAVRLSVLRSTGLRFDESLPLYAWQEDAELSCRLSLHGAIVRVDGARGVHLGVKSGRSPGLQLGYSQVINPLYIAVRVPAYTKRRALAQVVRNVVANMLRAVTPEPWIDRRGRLRGNILGLSDALRGRLTPDRIVALSVAARRPAALRLGSATASYQAVGQHLEPGPTAYQRLPPA